jgi:hypothetical protein
MIGKVYSINKGVNKAVEFKGLKAQYIWHVAGVTIGMMILFTVLHVTGVSLYISLPGVLGIGGVFIMQVFKMSRKYGQYGLMKRRARKELPKALVSRSRKCFIQLFSDYASKTR